MIDDALDDRRRFEVGLMSFGNEIDTEYICQMREIK